MTYAIILYREIEACKVSHIQDAHDKHKPNKWPYKGAPPCIMVYKQCMLPWQWPCIIIATTTHYHGNHRIIMGSYNGPHGYHLALSRLTPATPWLPPSITIATPLHAHMLWLSLTKRYPWNLPNCQVFSMKLPLSVLWSCCATFFTCVSTTQEKSTGCQSGKRGRRLCKECLCLILQESIVRYAAPCANISIMWQSCDTNSPCWVPLSPGILQAQYFLLGDSPSCPQQVLKYHQTL